ncbi:MAG: LacI family DNA-binding transcriptional regulator [Anaerolineae bacterium]
MNDATVSKKNLNLEIIASKANVSRSTVSRVINNKPYVSPKTRARVLAIIEQEGFSPNAAARMLATQRTETIGIVIENGADVFDDNYFFSLMKGIARAANQRHYALLLHMRDTRIDLQTFYDSVLRNRLMDGLVITTVTSDQSFIERLRDNDIRYVTVDRAYNKHDDALYATIDNVAATKELILHVIQNCGRRRIGIVSGPTSNVDGVDRLEGYRQALEEAGVPYDPELVYEGDFTRRSGYEGAKALLPQKPDCIFGANDFVALGVYDALTEAGVRIPDEVALVGFDDLVTVVSQITPRLTTVHHPVLEKGEAATHLLLDAIEGHEEGPKRIILPTQLIVRESCGYAIESRRE